MNTRANADHPIWSHPDCRLIVRPYSRRELHGVTAGYHVELFGPVGSIWAVPLEIIAVVEGRGAGRTTRRARKVAQSIAGDPSQLERLIAARAPGVRAAKGRSFEEVDREIRWRTHGDAQELDRRRKAAIAAGLASFEMPVDIPDRFV